MPSMLCPLPRYLSTGSESASLYLNVIKVEDQDIVCEATNSAVMDGLMTVRSAGPRRLLIWLRVLDA